MSTKGLRTRQEIVDASLQLFSVKGYYNTSISDILQATGLTKGGLYGHFGSKEELWDAAYERSVQIWQEIVFAGVREIAHPIERVMRALENDLHNYIGGEVFRGGCFFFNMLVELSGQSERMAGRILDGYRTFSNLLACWIEEGRELGILRNDVDSREVAEFILTAINGAAVLYAASREPTILAVTIHQLHLYLDCLKCEKP
jgi:TetR/AcrR family transcriptional regulator, transcriptional repressor for nem operon